MTFIFPKIRPMPVARRARQTLLLRAALLRALLAPCVASIALAQEELPITVEAPSGFDVTLHEVLFEEQPYTGETMIVIRIEAPAIGSRVLAANLQADMEWACETWGLPRVETLASPTDQIVVELMEELIPRGQPAPETRQFFETYRPENGLCIWELF